MIMARSDALREAQARISERIVGLLGLTKADYASQTWTAKIDRGRWR